MSTSPDELTGDSPHTFTDEPPRWDLPGTVHRLAGGTYCGSGEGGDIDQTERHIGLLVDDWRLLSQWRLAINGRLVEPLSVHEVLGVPDNAYSVVFIGRVPTADERPASDLRVDRRRYVGDGLREDITITNPVDHPTQVRVELVAGTDFASLFDVKRCAAVTTTAGWSFGDNEAHLLRPTGDGVFVGATASMDSRVGRTTITIDSPEIELDAAGALDEPTHLEAATFGFSPTIGPRESWTVSLQVSAIVDGQAREPMFPLDLPIDQAPPVQRTRQWQHSIPRYDCSDDTVAHTLQASVRDLDALRLRTDNPHRATLAAGAPWFLRSFGRDMLIASWMALPLDPLLAVGTLFYLARHQGTNTNRRTEEQPGRIMHEMMAGGANFGSVDATPLFVMLAAECARWAALNDEQLREILPHVDRAMGWIRGNITSKPPGSEPLLGFLTYQQSHPKNLPNQGWKDNPYSIRYANGNQPKALPTNPDNSVTVVGPLAVCEAQGYAYAAFQARADIAHMLGDDATEQRCRAEATHIYEAFNDRFWLPEAGYYAVALDMDGTPIDSLTSNNGHLLWAGIANPDKATSVADHLLSEPMFTGWGIRTLARSMAAYDMAAYHLGSVWPHDTAIAAAGLARYSHTDRATQVAVGVLDAANHFGGRLPELFSGEGRDTVTKPVPYSTACSPQAWAATTPHYLLGALLGLHPDLTNSTVELNPALPGHMLPLHVNGVRLGDRRIDITVTNPAEQAVTDSRPGSVSSTVHAIRTS